MATHRIVGSEVGRRTTPGNGALRQVSRSRKRKLGGWGLLFAPIVLLGGAVATVMMWPFR